MGAGAVVNIPKPSDEHKVIASTIPFPTKGLKLSYVNEFYDLIGGKEYVKELTTTEINDIYQKKITEKYKLSFCDYLSYLNHPAVGEATVFISHAWRYKFIDVMDALQELFRDEPDVIIWFDLFSNNQHIAVDLDFHWWCGTYKSAIRKFGHTVMVLSPWNDPIPLRRGWCIWELYCTFVSKSKFAIALSAQDGKKFLDDILNNGADKEINMMLSCINAEESQCYRREDQENIFTVIRKEVGFNNINAMIFDLMRCWVITTTTRFMNNEKDEIRKLDFMYQLGLLYHNQSKYKEAEALYIECLARREETVGENHPSSLKTLRILGRLYYHQGKYVKAERMFSDCLKRNKEGESHPITLKLIKDLADIFYQQGKYRQAEPLYVNCFLKNKEILGENHPNTLESISYLAGVYNKVGKYDLAERLFIDCLEKSKEILGENHPSSLKSINDLAMLYKSICKYDESERLLIIVAKKTKEILGEDHRDTVACMNNLANVYSDQGKYDYAESLLLACQEKTSLLGEDHPDIFNTNCMLALLYGKTPMRQIEKSFALFNSVVLKGIKVLEMNGVDMRDIKSEFSLLYSNHGEHKFVKNFLLDYNDVIKKLHTASYSENSLQYDAHLCIVAFRSHFDLPPVISSNEIETMFINSEQLIVEVKFALVVRLLRDEEYDHYECKSILEECLEKYSKSEGNKENEMNVRSKIEKMHVLLKEKPKKLMGVNFNPEGLKHNCKIIDDWIKDCRDGRIKDNHCLIPFYFKDKASGLSLTGDYTGALSFLSNALIYLLKEFGCNQTCGFVACILRKISQVCDVYKESLHQNESELKNIVLKCSKVFKKASKFYELSYYFEEHTNPNAEVQRSQSLVLCFVYFLIIEAKLDKLDYSSSDLALSFNLNTPITTVCSKQWLQENELQVPPNEIIQTGQWLNVIKFFQKSISEGSVDFSQIRIDLVGKGTAGKTCLINALLNMQNNTSDYIEISERTVGIARSVLSIENEIKLIFFDHAGQLSYRLMHYLFLKSRCIFILTYDAGEDNNESLDDIILWLHNFYSSQPSAKVILVGTHIDNQLANNKSKDIETEVRAEINRLNQSFYDEFDQIINTFSLEWRSYEDNWKIFKKEFKVYKLQDFDFDRKRSIDEFKMLIDEQVNSSYPKARSSALNILKIHQRYNSAVNRLRVLCDLFDNAIHPEFVERESLTYTLTDESAVIFNKYKRITGITLLHTCVVDSITGNGIKELRAKLIEISLSLDYFQAKIPKSYLDFGQKIESLDKSRVYCLSNEKDAIFLKEKLSVELDYLKIYLEFWSNIGTIFLYQDQLFPACEKLVNLLKPLTHHEPNECVSKLDLKNDQVKGLLKDLKGSKLLLDKKLLQYFEDWKSIDKEVMSEETCTAILSLLEMTGIIIPITNSNNKYTVIARILDVKNILADEVLSDSANTARMFYIFDTNVQTLLAKLHCQLSLAKPINVNLGYKINANSLKIERKFSASDVETQFIKQFCHITTYGFCQYKGNGLPELEAANKQFILEVTANDFGILKYVIRELENLLYTGLVGLKFYCYVPTSDKCDWHEFKTRESLLDKLESNMFSLFKKEHTDLVRDVFTMLKKQSIFLSHCWEDGTECFVDYLKHRIEAVTLTSVWYDNENMDSYGSKFIKEMKDGLLSCGTAIICLTPRYFTRRNCLYELEIALELCDQNKIELVVLSLHPLINYGVFKNKLLSLVVETKVTTKVAKKLGLMSFDCSNKKIQSLMEKSVIDNSCIQDLLNFQPWLSNELGNRFEDHILINNNGTKESALDTFIWNNLWTRFMKKNVFIKKDFHKIDREIEKIDDIYPQNMDDLDFKYKEITKDLYNKLMKRFTSKNEAFTTIEKKTFNDEFIKLAAFGLTEDDILACIDATEAENNRRQLDVSDWKYCTFATVTRRNRDNIWRQLSNNKQPIAIIKIEKDNNEDF